MATSLSNNRGFTLIEVMFAVVILLIGLLGLLQSVNVSMEHNVRNTMRDDAVKVAEANMRDLKVIPFASLTNTFPVVSSAINGIKGRNYIITRSSTGITTDSRELVVRVDWKYRGKSNSHELHSVKSRELN